MWPLCHRYWGRRGLCGRNCYTNEYKLVLHILLWLWDCVKFDKCSWTEISLSLSNANSYSFIRLSYWVCVFAWWVTVSAADVEKLISTTQTFLHLCAVKMKSSILLIILFYGISTLYAAKIKKCLSSLPNSSPSGVEVNYTTNKVTFPPTTQDPTAESKISTKYDTKGLDPFFNLAKSFMNTVQKKGFPDFKGMP